MNIGGRTFREVWAVDFEFSAPDGERPKPICLVAHELCSGQVLRVWQDDLLQLRRPPYSVDAGSLFVAYYASAEIGCHLALNWPNPANILDLYVEFRNLTNGFTLPCGAGLLGALTWFGIDNIDAAEKESMRELAIRGGPFTDREAWALLDYCESDATTLGKLLTKMQDNIDIDRALLRGRYMPAAAKMEWNGIPIDADYLADLRENWEGVKDQLVGKIDQQFGVYSGFTFDTDAFSDWLIEHDIAWPQTAKGNLCLDDDTFRDMAKAHPILQPLRELRVSLSEMRLEELAVGIDDRNRCILSAFRTKTGRNAPSNTHFIFGPAVWLREIIRPEPGCALAYLEWSQQEFGIAAALSGDAAMMEAYQSGDPYLTFAKQAGAVPSQATKQTHGAEREQFKACALGVQYMMGEQALAERINRPPCEARELLRLHRQTYSRFWAWSQAAVDHACLLGYLQTVFGWTIHAGPDLNPRSFANYPMQANGAEMLRLACILATEAGIEVCAPVHDAILIHAPIDDIEDHVRQTREIMAEASGQVLGGFRLRSDCEIVRYPDHYSDSRGCRMADCVRSILDELADSQGVSRRYTNLYRGDTPVQSTISLSCNTPHATC